MIRHERAHVRLTYAKLIILSFFFLIIYRYFFFPIEPYSDADFSEMLKYTHQITKDNDLLSPTISKF